MTENRAAKVEIKSKRFGEELVNEIISTTSNVVEETSELNEEERALWMNSFREVCSPITVAATFCIRNS